MPAAVRFARLVDDFVATLERLSATVIRSRARDDVRPARMRVTTGSGTTDCILFLWNITRGGGVSDSRPANERRIQLTGVSGIPLEPRSRTLVGGWSAEFGVYAFWDPLRHIHFSSQWPSIQVTSETLETAHRVGIATYVRPAAAGKEVVVAVAPDSLLWYVQNGLAVHGTEDDAVAAVELAEATPEEERNFLDEAQGDSQVERRFQLVQSMRAYRDAQFRPKVLRAYSYRCAVCQCALKLVDAAHIVPVSHPTSTDEITNGLALCRLHHGAYDTGLLGVRSDYTIVVNPESERRLAALQLQSGLTEFKQRLPERIVLPGSHDVRPLPRYLVEGMRARHWPDTFVA